MLFRIKKVKINGWKGLYTGGYEPVNPGLGYYEKSIDVRSHSRLSYAD